MTDYEKQAAKLGENWINYSLGEEVNTEFGKGIIVKLAVHYNGLYLSPETAEVTVWYSTAREGSKWVNFTFKLREISKL